MSPTSCQFYLLFINFLTKDGKKSQACKLFYTTCLELKKHLFAQGEKKSKKRAHRDQTQHLDVLFSQALENVKPSLEVRKVRIAGNTYLVPAVVPQKKQYSMAIKWILESAAQRKKKSKNPFSHCLAEELLDASQKQGQAREKRDVLHRLAQANRAYIRYRWW